MELTWLAIVASLLMGGGALLIFIWAVRSHQFQSFEDVKYQVFWADQGIPARQRQTRLPNEEQKDGSNSNGNQVK
jgi:cbb3-type cytochrome oxidase maturation protein